MNQAIVNIMVDRIQDQFFSEKLFSLQYLDISYEEWLEWKSGKKALSADKMQKLKALFSDYEWMLIQKIARQTIIFPEKRNYIVPEYKRLKASIAKTWIKSGLATAELITQQRAIRAGVDERNKRNCVNLRISVNYQEWGYDDILEFFMPEIIQQQIIDSQVDLLEWVDENLSETYIEKNIVVEEEPIEE
ncbi:hypothetical protein [Vagococcus silagei]|uniref:Uncharacterized protein n=1 Tax=Vagococcus silagei TaxID=2508885 RepID=A0A4S3B6V0_9ENTE|nr:hypothetical protein [Vagococcus silagei]THB62388.1 hypothetical protein ESZ54_00825 [Vagococcus silagei]